jgi:hypothetical protein
LPQDLNRKSKADSLAPRRNPASEFEGPLRALRDFVVQFPAPPVGIRRKIRVFRAAPLKLLGFSLLF